MKKYLLGIDIGGTTVKLGLFNINGKQKLERLIMENIFYQILQAL